MTNLLLKTKTKLFKWLQRQIVGKRDREREGLKTRDGYR